MNILSSMNRFKPVSYREFRTVAAACSGRVIKRAGRTLLCDGWRVKAVMVPPQIDAGGRCWPATYLVAAPRHAA